MKAGLSALESTGNDARPVIVFDGVCVLCNGWVQLLLRHDRARRYRFASMQSAVGRQLLQAHGLDPDDPVSFLLVGQDRTWSDTDALRQVLASVGGVWRIAHLLGWIPRRLRDPLYRLIARNRYRWFGRHDRCYLPPIGEEDRFLG